MPAPVEQLFQLKAADVGGTLWGSKFVYEASAALSASITAGGAGTDTDVAKDKAFWVSNIQAYAAPDATQTCVDLSVGILDEGGNVKCIIAYSGEVLAAGEPRSINLPIDLLLLDENNIVATGTFDAGVAANSVILSLAGIETPRGNVAPI